MAKLESILVAVKKASESIGISKLKDEQKDALVAFASGRDVFVSLSTGVGKVVYQVCLLDLVILNAPVIVRLNHFQSFSSSACLCLL